MSFLYPSFLFGLLAVSVPVAIHLFNFRRTRRVFFTNVALLKTVQTETKSFRRLKHYLILLFRSLFVICLVLAFAQPFIPSKSRLGLSRTGLTSLYLDNSYSMQNELNEKRYLDIATSKLDQLLGLFRNATSLQLVTNDFSSQEQTVGTADALRDRVTTIRFAHTPRTLADVYRRQLNLLATNNPSGPNQLFWFSDFQKSTVGDLSRLSIDTTNRLFLVPLETQPTKNVFVDSVWLSTPFIRELQNNTLNVRVRNSGEESVRNLPIKLFIDQTQVSTASVTLPGKGEATASLNFNVTQKGFRRGRITFEDYPITFDNEYYFVIQASPSIRVLHLYDQKSEANYVENVYGNDSLFVRQSFSAQNVDVGQFKTADLVVLEGLNQVGGTLRSELERFVRQGGSLIVIPPTTPNATAWSSFLASLGAGGLQTQTPPLPSSQPLSAPNRQSPFFRDIFERTSQQGIENLPNAVPVWQWRVVGERLLTLRNGTPFLTQSRTGGSAGGQVYIFASPLNTDYGNLAQHALFVPIMYKIAALSVRPQRTAYSFDENTIDIGVSNASPNAVYKLKRDKLEIIPIQRVNGTQLIMELPKSNQLNDGQQLASGYYELQLNGKTEKLLAFNHGNRESQMDFYTSDELRRIFAGQPNVQVFDSIQDDDFVDELRQQNLGTNLWKYFIIAALVFLLAEVAVIRFMKG
ncbi:BatA domain-containing protein [Larkinella insperata]|uniref:BatA domain-containing protein n=1 Tax=Larkinella insperata TaxID=332158 RepID=A0ABW3QAJ7_9BACT|nr:BatA domain-containing protein [Larkinella insperata]